MNTLKFHEIISKNRDLKDRVKDKVSYKILLSSNIVVDQLADFIEFGLRTQGVNAHVVVGDFDNIAQGVANNRDVDAHIIFWDIGNIAPNFFSRMNFLSKAEILKIENKVYKEIDLVLEATKSSKILMINKFSSLMYESNVIGENEVQNIARKLNDRLENSKNDNQLIINIDNIICSLGLKNAINLDKFLIYRNLFTLDFFRAYSQKIIHPLLRSAGKYKKVLVLDCDNTLWGGIIGEDGLSGILLGYEKQPDTYFYNIQSKIKKLKNKGVMLAICSKNNPLDVVNVFHNHPHSILSEDDFVSIKCNWDNKVKNIIEISNELNLGLDSFVFLDDSEFELKLVMESLPEVACFRAPIDLKDYIDVFSKIEELFYDGRALTDEDFLKTEMYNAESIRKNIELKFDNIDDYLKSLGLKLSITTITPENINRVSQLTLKTNQFNLTTIRYSAGELEDILRIKSSEIFAINVSDKYGDYGLTAVVIVRALENDTSYLDSFLMSCRIIGRNLEYKIFSEVSQILFKKHFKILHASYVPTSKNGQTADFYKRVGMKEVNVKNGIVYYELDLENFKISTDFDYIEVNHEL